MTLLKIEWKNNQKNLLAWCISLILIIFLFMSIFPSLENSGMRDMLTTKLDTLPENMLKAFHLNSGPSLVETTGYFAYVFQYIFIAASMYAVMLGTKMLVKEETEGTIEFLYAQPISRKKIVLDKLLASLTIITLFWVTTFLASLGAALLFNKGNMTTEDIFSGLTKIFVTEWFVLLFFLSLGFLLSSVLKQANLGVSMGLVFVFYLMGILGDLQESLSILKDISPMAQAGPAAILENKLNVILMAILVLISLLLCLGALLIYQRKDLEI